MRQKLLALFVIFVTPLAFAGCDATGEKARPERSIPAPPQPKVQIPDGTHPAVVQISASNVPEAARLQPTTPGKMYWNGVEMTPTLVPGKTMPTGKDLESMPYALATLSASGCAASEAPASTSTRADRDEATELISQIRKAPGTSGSWGTGCIVEKAAISNAAESHAWYMENSSPGCRPPDGHNEFSYCTGFTGLTPMARIDAHTGTSWGSNPGGNEVACTLCGLVTSSIQTFMNTPYHVSPFLDFRAEYMGVGWDTDTVVIDFGHPSSNPSHLGTYKVWPPPGSWGTPTHFDGFEIPQPPHEPGHLWRHESIVLGHDAGPVISVYDSLFTLTSIGIQRHSDWAWLDNHWIGPGNDPNGYLGTGEYRMYPTYPLAATTTYRAHFYGTRNGVAASHVWDFTTGPIAYK